MLFNSLEFAVFFPLVTLAFFLIPKQYRAALLFIASCYFYMALIPQYILILFGLILVDYIAGIWIETSKAKATALYCSIAANLGVLFFFKYYNFFALNTNAVLGQHLPLTQFVLPVGLSFHIFQSLSYTIEVYYGRQIAERNLLRYGLYVLFYPQLVAGPIERPQNLLHQLKLEKNFDYERFQLGMKKILSGLFKKVIIADLLAAMVNRAFGNPETQAGSTLLAASYFFSIQIYCDFSGYTEIARGAAQIMGVDLMENFRWPYMAESLSDFWRRWHISLSSWFRDYLYIPLGGNRKSPTRTYVNLLIVFIVSGFWHGANWTFGIWGLIHGIILSLENLARPYLRTSAKSQILKPIRVFFVFHIVTLAWIFFRAPTVNEAFVICRKIFTWDKGSTELLSDLNFTIGISLIFGLLLFQMIFKDRDFWSWLNQKSFFIKTLVTGAFICLFIVLFVTSPSTPQKFIYFQF